MNEEKRRRPRGIPVCFYNEREGGKHPTARTVGKLIKELQRLPVGLKVKQSFCDGVKLVVYNAGQPSMALMFEELDY